MAGSHTQIKASNRQMLCEEMSVDSTRLSNIEQKGDFANLAVRVYDKGETLNHVCISLAVPLEDASLRADGFARIFYGQSDEFSGDQIFLQSNKVGEPDFVLQAQWETETQDPDCQIEDDIDVAYLAVPLSSLSALAKLVAEVKVSPDTKFDLFALNKSDSRVDFDEINGRQSVLVSDVLAFGAKAFLPAIEQLQVEQVRHQLEKLNVEPDCGI